MFNKIGRYFMMALILAPFVGFVPILLFAEIQKHRDVNFLDVAIVSGLLANCIILTFLLGKLSRHGISKIFYALAIVNFSVTFRVALVWADHPVYGDLRNYALFIAFIDLVLFLKFCRRLSGAGA